MLWLLQVLTGRLLPYLQQINNIREKILKLFNNLLNETFIDHFTDEVLISLVKAVYDIEKVIKLFKKFEEWHRKLPKIWRRIKSAYDIKICDEKSLLKYVKISKSLLKNGYVFEEKFYKKLEGNIKRFDILSPEIFSLIDLMLEKDIHMPTVYNEFITTISDLDPKSNFWKENKISGNFPISIVLYSSSFWFTIFSVSTYFIF